jgi:hypothetical protein
MSKIVRVNMTNKPKKSMLKTYKIEFEIAVRNPATVIRTAHKLYQEGDWKERVKELDGDELFVAVDTLFATSFVIPDHLWNAIDFLGSGCDDDGEIRSDWSRMVPGERK